QDLRGHAFPLAHQSEQDVLRADVVVAQLERLSKRELQDLLGPRGERDVPRGRRLALPDDQLDLSPDGVRPNAHARQRQGCDALALADQAEQDVLGADVVVIEQPRLLLGEDHGPASPIREPLEHAPSIGSRSELEQWTGHASRKASPNPANSPNSGSEAPKNATFPKNRIMAVCFCIGSPTSQNRWNHHAAGVTNAATMSAPTSGQIPRPIDNNAA